MKKLGKKPEVLVFALLMLTGLLVGCGGSGGGSGSSGGGSGYTGNSEAAAITDSNAKELAASAYDSSALEGPFGELASLSTGDSTASIGQGRPLLLKVSQVLQTALFKADPAAATSATAARAVEPIENCITGSCDGSACYSIQPDENSGAFSGSFNFSSFCEDDTTLDGQASFSGRVDPDTIELQFFTITLTDLGGTSDEESFRLNGELSITAVSNPSVMSLDLLYEDVGAGETLWLDDFTISVTETDDYDDVSIAGRVYHPEHGYVDIQTTTAFRIESGDDYPSQGVMVLTGADDTKARMTVLSNTQYQMEADTNGDGTYDWGPETCEWDE